MVYLLIIYLFMKTQLKLKIFLDGNIVVLIIFQTNRYAESLFMTTFSYS